MCEKGERYEKSRKIYHLHIACGSGVYLGISIYLDDYSFLENTG